MDFNPEDLPTRWEIELEFVQSLSNIQYVNYLAQNNYLNNPEFLKYLEYLNYWKRKEYAKFLVYPNCLHVLTLLQKEEFRRNIVNPEFINVMMNHMVQRWQSGETENDNVEGGNVEGKGEGNVGDIEGNAEQPNNTIAQATETKGNGEIREDGETSKKNPDIEMTPV